ncbi:putative hit finger domain protein [Botryosphaeria dothidea]|uniref:Hit finger domain protein n=1 Tax=Botryosphaeria dothidea TaxID=55169 RepID=A0A8H4ITH9_9PEZI|nr:putative hit finger domain protein [Botryosphaeria dothidea]
MPHIEVIPITSGAAPAPGWAYVPDTGYDPSKAAINPTGRKRTARQDVGGTHDLSARQQTALHKRVTELDRDNQKEITLPAKPKEGGSTPREKAGGKMTPAVRKILQSGRTFAHWLADEEALNAQRQAGGPGGHSSAAQTASLEKDSRIADETQWLDCCTLQSCYSICTGRSISDQYCCSISDCPACDERRPSRRPAS